MARRAGPGLRLALTTVALSWSLVAAPALAAKPGLSGSQALARASAIRKDLSEIVQKARAPSTKSEAELAERLVEGQLKLTDEDPEGAAIVFLDLLENHPGTPVAKQALVYLGEALVELGMHKWATEVFGRNLSDTDVEAKRFHQRSLARLLVLAAPARKEGFARRPGLSATPEVRARLEAVGVSVEQGAPEGSLADTDVERLVAWVERLPLDQREPQLSYAYGRWLFLRGLPERALAPLEVVAPIDESLAEGGRARPYRIRAAYVAGAAALSTGDLEAAVARFDAITKIRTRDERDRAIIELSWMALGRIFHDEGDIDRSVDAYRKISRDSVYFPEAMYETAWTLLRAGRNEAAITALDLLLVYDPESPIVPEIKQLRGKVRIQERDWPGAEREFLELRREFSDLGQRVGKNLQAQSGAGDWFASVVAEDMPHFAIDALMPVEAARLAEALPRAVQARDLAREVGILRQELDDVRTLLAKMEVAVDARERAQLFDDLAAYMAGLDAAELELLEVQESILLRVRVAAKNSGLERIDNRRRELRRVVDDYASGEKSQLVQGERLQKLGEANHNYELAIAALKAQLVASERYYEQTRARQKLDDQGFLAQAAQMRDEIALLEADARAQRDEIDELRTELRFDAPAKQRQRKVLAEYGAFLERYWVEASKLNSDPKAREAWAELAKLRQQIQAARRVVDAAALDRLQRAIVILQEERVNLDAYLVEMEAMQARTRGLVGEVMQATTHDVVAELQNLIVRSEVGLLDVAWAIQEVEAEEIRRLEMSRDRDLREVDALMQQAMEELQ